MAYPTVTVHHKKYPHTSVMSSPYLCDNTGTLDCAADLEDLKAYLSNTGPIYFPEGTYLISTDLTIPAGMVMIIPKNAKISVATGVTLTIASQPQVGVYQWIVLAGTGQVVFSNPVEVHAEWWGTAAGAIQAAHDSLPSAGGTINIGTDYTETAGITISKSDVRVIKHGDVVLTFDDAVTEAVTISGYRVDWPNIKLLKTTNTWKAGTDTDSIGLYLYNCRYCRINAYVEAFFNGIKCHGVGDGTVHNTIFINHVYDCRTGVYITNGLAGWANSNVFIGGRVGYRSSTCATANGNSVYTYNVYIGRALYSTPPDVYYSNNNNLFLNVAFENYNYDTTRIFYTDAQYNELIGCRMEISSYDGSYTPIIFGANSLYNKIIGGRWVSQAYDISLVVNDLGSRNNIFHGDELYTTSTRAYWNSVKISGSPAVNTNWTAFDANLVVRNTSTSAANLIQGNNSSDAEKFSLTGYGQLRLGFDGATPGTANGMLQLRGHTTTGYPEAQWRETTNYVATAAASAVNVNCEGYTPPTADSALYVKVHVIGHALDSSKAIIAEITGLYNFTGGTLTLIGSDTVATSAHGGDSSTIELKVSTIYPVVKITPDSAASRTWAVKWEWLTLGAAS